MSHDLAAVEATCSNGIWLHNGEARTMGPIRDVLADYRGAVEGDAESRTDIEGRIKVSQIEAASPDGGLAKTGEQLDIDLTLHSDERYRAWIYLGVTEGAATPIFLLQSGPRDDPRARRDPRAVLDSRRCPGSGRYYMWGGVYRNWTQGEELIGWQPLTEFDVYGPELDAAPRAVVRLSPIHVESSWEIDGI